MMPSLRSWLTVRTGIAVASAAALALGTWLVGSQIGVQANPSVNGVCDGADRCLEPTEVSTFLGRAIESDPDQAVGKHEWDFTGTGTYGNVVTCVGAACRQSCNDLAHPLWQDCSATDYSYSSEAFFASTNERQVTVGMRGVDTEGAAGVAQTRKVGVAIAYVGPDRGSSNLAVSGVGAGSFTVTWRDVTDVPGSAYTLHVDNLDDGTGDTIPVTNDKAIGDAYSVAYTADPSTDYLVWVVVYYPTPTGSIVRQNLPPSDPIVGVPVTTPANGLPTLTIQRQPGNVPPAAAAPHYQLLRQAGNVLTLNITVADPDGDQLAELRIDGLASLPGATFSGFSTPTPGPVTRTMTWNLNMAPPPSGDYSINVVARDVVGGTASRAVVIRLNSNPDAPTSLQVNTNDATSGLASGDPSPVAQVIDDNLADQNLKFTYRHADPDGDAAANYRIQVDTDSAFASPQTWDSGSQSLAVANGTRSANVTYTGPALAYSTDYWWRVQVGDGNGNLSSYGAGRFRLRPTNYAPVLDPIGNRSVDVGATLTFTMTAFDQDVADGIQTLSYLAQGGLPSPRMALNPLTGAFTFTPSSADLPPASPYTVTLCARDSFTPTPAQDCETITITVNLNLAAPTGLSVSFTSPTAGTATWTHSAPGEDGFQLDQTAPVSTPNILSVAANVTSGSFTFNQCGSTSTVGFQVRAFVDTGVRQFSAAASGSASRPGFATPTGLSVAATGNTTARLSWTPGTTGQTGYAVYNGGTRLADAPAAATSYDFSGLTPASSYTFRVRPLVGITGCLPGNEALGATASVAWTQPNPALTVTPSSLAFGNVVKDANSATQTVTVRNTGGVVLTGITAAIAGADAGQFSLLNTPPASLALNATWDAQVQFRPTSYGAKSAQLQIAAPSFGLSSNVALTGTGVPTAPVITSASWDANEPSRYSLAWTWGPGDPDDFSIQMPLGTEQFRLTLGNQRARNNQLLTSSYCYSATGTTHTINLLAFDGGYSVPATANLGTRPGWEAMGGPTSTVWLSDTSARLTWADPAPARSRYEVRVWTTAPSPVAIFSATTTDDATSIDLTGLVAGTNYNVTVRPLRLPIDLPGCSAPIYGSRVSFAYRQPIVDIEVYVQDTPASSPQIFELDGGGVLLGDALSFPLRIKNNGDPIVIGGFSSEITGGGVPGGISLSTSWPVTDCGGGVFGFCGGATWNTNVQLGVSGMTGPELEVRVQLETGVYGRVLDFPIRMVALSSDPATDQEIFVTAAGHIGDFGNSQAQAEQVSNDFCMADTRRNPLKSYRALLWYSNSPLPGVLSPGTLYFNRSGEFVFGTRPSDVTPPYTAHRPIWGVSPSVWSGRGIGGEAYNCSEWTGNGMATGATVNPSSLGQWSLGSGASVCFTNSKPIYCVSYPTTSVTVSPLTHDFGFVQFSSPAATQQVVITNTGSSNVTLTSVSIVGGGGDFSLVSPVALGSFSSGQTRTANVQYDPAGTPGSNTATLRIVTTEAGTIDVALSGHGIQTLKRIALVNPPNNGGFLAVGVGTPEQRADAICQADPLIASLGGTWKALLKASDAFVGTALHGGVTYASATNPGSVLFTAATDNDVSQPMISPLTGSTTYVWTGDYDFVGDCNAWTSNNAGSGGAGRAWTAAWTPADQLRWFSGGLGIACYGSVQKIYCVEQ